MNVKAYLSRPDHELEVLYLATLSLVACLRPRAFGKKRWRTKRDFLKAVKGGSSKVRQMCHPKPSNDYQARKESKKQPRAYLLKWHDHTIKGLV